MTPPFAPEFGAAPEPESAPEPKSAPGPPGGPSFRDLVALGVSKDIIETIEKDMKFTSMTPVQGATIPQLLQSRQDVVAQARTGTGKTLAFLLPSIQAMIRRKKPGSGLTSLLVIAPTRDLALQIAAEAKALLKPLPQYKVRVSIGQTNVNTERKAILSGCDILVATPGRLLDHLRSTDENSAICRRMQKLDTLILDEADRLLDMGFVRDLQTIVSYLPQADRQTMLFSATFPDKVEKISQFALSPDGYKFISTVPRDEAPTHDRVPQYLITVPSFSDMLPALVGALQQEQKHVGAGRFKAIVFAPTAGHVKFYHAVLANQDGLPPRHEFHGRISQPARKRIVETFKTAKNGILIATDIVARGMDFPAVTTVFQAGVPDDKDNYVHRLGRTARAGAEGRGILLITPNESYFTADRLFKGVNFQKIPADLSSRDGLKHFAKTLDPVVQSKMYQAWLGFYKSLLKPLKWSTRQLVEEANKLAMDGLGCAEVPGVKMSVISKMGLRNVPNLVVLREAPSGRGSAMALD